MRQREKERIVEKTRAFEDADLGETMYFRPFETDDKKITEIARFAGEKRSETVRKLVHAALLGKDLSFGGQAERDANIRWLMHHAKQHNNALEELARRLDEQTKHSGAVEVLLSGLSKKVDQLAQLAAELYCGSHASLSVLGESYAKLLTLSSPVPEEREYSVHFANNLVLSQIERAASELSLCTAHHQANNLDIKPKELYIFSKVEPYKQKLGIGRKSGDREPLGDRL